MKNGIVFVVPIIRMYIANPNAGNNELNAFNDLETQAGNALITTSINDGPKYKATNTIGEANATAAKNGYKPEPSLIRLTSPF